ncbi:hypothetical protein [Undibacterium curvum]|uniref:Virus attachment protein p12 family n=1 Tax=Undibacterium curvum TaxID=2762294 RepID=A0ABR7A0A3_9BURK|nr:hypothetical protein [Undibacterium curvum]MBC3930348.1 hypothetical protein [Undibacterium curvum]
MLQTIITISLVFMAAAYLLLKWLPGPWATRLHLRLQKISPASARRFRALSRTCGDSCSSGCGGCASSEVKAVSADIDSRLQGKTVIYLKKQ